MIWFLVFAMYLLFAIIRCFVLVAGRLDLYLLFAGRFRWLADLSASLTVFVCCATREFCI